jgi:hypothetical protein
VAAGETVSVPLWASVTCDLRKPVQRAVVRTMLHGWDTLGRKRFWGSTRNTIDLKPWMSEEVSPLEIRMPRTAGLAVLAILLEDSTGRILHRNFTTFLVTGGDPSPPTDGGAAGRRVRLARFDPARFDRAQWSLKQWNVLDGLKVNGAGSGYFEYRVPWPAGLELSSVEDATLVLELSAKQLFGKDREGVETMGGDYMRGRGTHDPSRNPNSYPMTDTVRMPSSVRVRIAGEVAGTYELPDDPADHRGVLSWYSQKRDRQLREAGSYGYLIKAPVGPEAVKEAAAKGAFVVRLEVDEALPGGLAIYGKRFGRYPLDPTLVFRLKD